LRRGVKGIMVNVLVSRVWGVSHVLYICPKDLSIQLTSSLSLLPLLYRNRFYWEVL